MAEARLKNDKDKGNYLELSFISQGALGEEIAKLKSYKRHHATAAESAQIIAEIADREAEIAKIRAERLAYLAEQRKIVPPTKEDMKKAIKRAKEIDEMIVSAQMLNALLAASADIVEIMAKTRE